MQRHCLHHCFPDKHKRHMRLSTWTLLPGFLWSLQRLPGLQLAAASFVMLKLALVGSTQGATKKRSAEIKAVSGARSGSGNSSRARAVASGEGNIGGNGATPTALRATCRRWCTSILATSVSNSAGPSAAKDAAVAWLRLSPPASPTRPPRQPPICGRS